MNYKTNFGFGLYETSKITTICTNQCFPNSQDTLISDLLTDQDPASSKVIQI